MYPARERRLAVYNKWRNYVCEHAVNILSGSNGGSYCVQFIDDRVFSRKFREFKRENGKSGSGRRRFPYSSRQYDFPLSKLEFN